MHFNNGKQYKENRLEKYESVLKWKMNEHPKLVDVNFKANYKHAEKLGIRWEDLQKNMKRKVITD